MKFTRCIIAIYLILVLSCAAKDKPITFKTKGILEGGKSIDVWVKATKDKKDPKFYRGTEWGYKPFPDCIQVDGKVYHYRTRYPMAPLPGPDGQDAIIVTLKEE